MWQSAGFFGEEGVHLWRLDQKRHAESWHSGEGAFRLGGRWNSTGVRAVYASLDPATAILEVAVHIGFPALDAQPHVLTTARISDPTSVHIVRAEDVPNPNWLVPVTAGPAQQAFGDKLLAQYRCIAIPSVVCRHSWNLVFDAARADRLFADVVQEPFALDPRLAG